MQTRRIRVLIADDHAIVLKGLAASIGAESDMEVVAAARDGRGAVELFRDKRPDIVIMDLNLTAEMTGVEAVQAIRRESPGARIIILSAYKGDEDIFSALSAGAATYLLKETLGDDLAPIIREVHAGGRPLPSEVGSRLADRVRHIALTAREIEVLRYIARGLRNKEIGAMLFISEDTVQEHVQNILTKLCVNGRTEAVTVALRRGIIRID